MCCPRPNLVQAIPRIWKACENTVVARMIQSSHQKVSFAFTARDQNRSTTAMVDIVMPTAATMMTSDARSSVRTVEAVEVLMARLASTPFVVNVETRSSGSWCWEIAVGSSGFAGASTCGMEWEERIPCALGGTDRTSYGPQNPIAPLIYHGH